MWAKGEDYDGMANELREGTYGDLNIYIQKSIKEGTWVVGLCTTPTYTGGEGTYQNDGCRVVADTLPAPGEDYNGLNGGKCAVHEVGHWLGLLHTFEGGCEGDGDFVDDTPAEKDAPKEACPVGRNSCPDQEGDDSIHNFMAYTSG